MSETQSTNGCFSAVIRMHLNVGAQTFVVGQLGPSFLILRSPTDHPPADGELHVSIDGRPRSWRVHLPDGIAIASPETRVEYRAA